MKFYLYILLFLLTNTSYTFAKEERFSGEPLPRFVSITKSSSNTRFGPDTKYPIKYIYQAKSQPVKVINEYYGWYQIKDIDGDVSWIHKNSCTKANYIMASHNETKLYEKDNITSNIIAKLNRGVIAKVKECFNQFCEVEVNYNNSPLYGFLIKNEIWGIYE